MRQEKGEMQRLLEGLVGKEIASVEVDRDYSNWEASFTLQFTDGTKLEVGSRGWDEGSIVTVDVR